MDLINVFLLCLMSCLIGAVLMLLLQYVAVVKFFKAPPIETTQEHAINQEFALPESIMCNVKSMDPATKNSMIAFNLIFQFLFYEARFSAPVRNWIYRKLTVELEELIAKTTVSKFFDKFLLRDLDLGTQFPEIRNLRVHNVDLHETECHIESLDVVMDLHYKGNFKVAIDGQMLLGKKVFLSIKVKQLSGLARLQFTRKPYSHWSVCFIGDPSLDLDIETLFQGRQLQPHLTGLLSNQIRKVVRRKHTLPTYKLRYRPFFSKCADQFARAASEAFAHGVEANGTGGPQSVASTNICGQLEVNISELSRLAVPANVNHVFCTVTAASMPWVQVRQHGPRMLAITLEVHIQRAKNQQLGIMFHQRTVDTVIVERVLPNTPATRANLMAGDRLLAIEERPVTTIPQLSKLIKAISRPEIVFRVERLRSGCISSDCGCDDAFGDYEDVDPCADADTITTDSASEATFTTAPVTRKNSADRTSLHSTASSVSNTPSSSPRKPADSCSNTTTASSGDVASRLARKLSKVTASRTNSDKVMVGDEIVMQTAAATAGPEEAAPATVETPLLVLQQHTTVNCLVNTLIKLNDLANFELSADTRWLNLCVYGQCNDTVQLLGFVNISVATLLAEYTQTSLWQLVKKLPISPPQPTSMATHQLSNLKGFEPKLCFGDVLLSFVWSGSASDEDLLGKQHTTNPEAAGLPGTHDFVRTQFNRSTQCEYCGKKIWLKDAVQCGRCNMITHKKCVKKCQIFTVCGAAADGLTAEPLNAVPQRPIVELRLTESEQQSEPAPEPDATVPSMSCLMTSDQQQQQQQQPPQTKNSFSDFLAQGMKRVNSVNNLAIPGMGAAGASFTRSLPPSPQHTPRKQSLVNQSTNPFAGVVLALEQLSDCVDDLEEEHIVALTQPLIGWGTAEELMGLAKTSSRSLYGDLEPNDSVDKINILLSRLRIVLDVETTNYSRLSTPTLATAAAADEPVKSGDSPSRDAIGVATESRRPSTASLSQTEETRRAFLIGQSEERVQALSVIMLHLCTGLQFAQGVATN